MVDLMQGVSGSISVRASNFSRKSASFSNLLVMPNIKPPVRTVEDAEAYRSRILDAAKSKCCVAPNLLMTLYLTDTTTPEEIVKVKQSGFVKALKLYPAGATTNSEFGVTSYGNIQEVLRKMADLQIPLLDFFVMDIVDQ